MKRIFLFPLLLFVSPLLAQNKPPAGEERSASIASFTSGMKAMPGFIPMYWDARKGKMWFEIGRFNKEILYFTALSAGVGSNDIGLDRGRIGPSHIVKFERSGNKVLMTESNYDFRAVSDNDQEKRAVDESFAHSVLWGFDVSAEDSGRVLVDATGFFTQQDAVGAIQAITRTKQGTYRLDPQRSAFYLPCVKNFPLNTEIEATITLTGDQAGNYLREVVPTPTAVSFRQHFSFVQLPDDKYKPRPFDPRAGVGSISYMDYSTPVSEPIMKRFMRRHRLEKKDLSAAVSEPVKPIVYYVDPGTPEPIRSALMEGTAWWNQAFEAAGFQNAFQVKLLPADADPMDIRYNLVQWVHRSSRGWSYGGGITDPRTGEIIKGKVTLGSLRVRQDFLISQGLVADFEDGKPLEPQMMELCLARMRQLAAHEVGHTLGLPHNYFSSVNERASVMDYPHPLVKLAANNRLDISDAYAKGIGDWDKVAITLAYRQFAQGQDEKKEIDKLIQGYMSKGLRFLSDQDARPAGSAHPATHLWDNGANAVDELDRIMKVRSVVLENFSEKKIPTGSPMATLEEVLVPMYMLHRYQVEAATKVVAGVDYSYALRGDGQQPVRIVPAKEQWRALEAVISTLSPEKLMLPEKLIALIPPHPYGYEKNARETFNGYTGMIFDPLAPAEAAADMTLSFLLHPERVARLIGHHALHPDLPEAGQVLDRLIEGTWKSPARTGYAGEVKRVVEGMVLQHLISLSQNKEAAFRARAVAALKVKELEQWLSGINTRDGASRAHYQFALSRIKNCQDNPEQLISPAPVAVPDGAPIGMDDNDWTDVSCLSE